LATKLAITVILGSWQNEERKKKKSHLRLEGAKGGGLNCIWEEFVPVPGCAREEGAASVVCAGAEALVLEAVMASSSTCTLE